MSLIIISPLIYPFKCPFQIFFLYEALQVTSAPCGLYSTLALNGFIWNTCSKYFVRSW